MGGVRAYLQGLVERGEAPGLQFACVRGDGPMEAYSAGWADLRARRPMTGKTPLMAYSMSKLLTVEAIAVLERSGRLGLDDPVARYVPEAPYGPVVTLRHLLEHRSGIGNPIPLRWVHPAECDGEFDERAALVEVLRAHPRLRFAPGTGRLYSNIGYWLLGRVVEEVTGERFAKYVEERVLAPMGIGRDEVGYLFPGDGREAAGYLERYSFLNLVRPWITDGWIAREREGRWVRIANHYVNGPAFGGAIGTAAGYCKFAWQVGERGGQDFVEKEGGGAGFHCLLRVNRPERRAGVVMANATGLDVRRVLDELEQMVGRVGADDGEG